MSFTDEVEVTRVREKRLKKKLELTDQHAELDNAIVSVGKKKRDDAREIE
jgi:hypothetical protein